MLASGTTLQGRYQVTQLLGEGGMGAVYEATDQRLSHTVALKETLAATDELKRAFEREARLLANLHHPSLPRVTDHFTEAGRQYLVMDFIPGDDLKSLIDQRGGPFPAADVLRWAGELLDALEYLHAYEPPIIHRDIKPANLKLTATGKIALLDFGLAKGRAGQMTHSGESLSLFGYTPQYAPLEQIQGERTDTRSDLYALAATLYNLLTGLTPPDALKRATEILSGEEDPLLPANQINPEVPTHVAAALQRAMALKPTERPKGAAEMRMALLSGMATATQQPPAGEGATTQGKLPMSGREVYVEEEITRISTSGEDEYQLPDVRLLQEPPPNNEQADEELLDLATRLAEKLREFGVTGRIEHICPGPVVTTYNFKPDPGVKYSRVTGLAEDLSLSLRAQSVRIERLPGTSHIGIEVSNPKRDDVYLRGIIESRAFSESPSKLTVALGRKIDGMSFIVDLATLPHLLIAGATGTGKSVCINSIIISVLYKAQPDEVKLILVDPKRLELGLYADIPHLAAPIITDAGRASTALGWAVSEMEHRYKELAAWGVRDLASFNEEVARRNVARDFDDMGMPWKPLPYILVVIDEIADLMNSEYDIEEPITRLAQTARAAGIHLVVATQRPSVDVVAGLIKANFAARISFKVSSKVDSRIVLDESGAEELLGRGDMLFLAPGSSSIVRVHGAYVDDAEVGRVVRHVRTQGVPVYIDSDASTNEYFMDKVEVGERDELFEQALRICVEMKRASTSILQRRLRISYGRAASILDAMEREGFIGSADGSRPRPVLGRSFETVSNWDVDGEAHGGTSQLFSPNKSIEGTVHQQENHAIQGARTARSPVTDQVQNLIPEKSAQSLNRLPWIVGAVLLLLILIWAIYHNVFS